MTEVTDLSTTFTTRGMGDFGLSLVDLAIECRGSDFEPEYFSIVTGHSEFDECPQASYVAENGNRAALEAYVGRLYSEIFRAALALAEMEEGEDD